MKDNMSQSTIDSEVRALDTIQRNIWARINDEVNLRGIKLSIGDAYALGSVIKEVLHPEVTNLIAQEANKAVEVYRDKLLAACPNCDGVGKVDCDNPTKTAQQNHLADDCEYCEWVREFRLTAEKGSNNG